MLFLLSPASERSWRSAQLRLPARCLVPLCTPAALTLLHSLCDLAVAAPKGFNPVEDIQDAYKFLYPFGWQEVAVTGADIVYKDVVEPLESVSVTLTATDKKDIVDFGELPTVRGSPCAESTQRKLLLRLSRHLRRPGCRDACKGGA
jgi:hypothetical protein